jgi:hypothetical protein
MPDHTMKMSFNDYSETIRFEHRCIACDINFYLDLLSKLIKKESSAILLFNFFPYLSLFTVETHQYITQNLPHHQNKLLDFDHQYQLIKDSRMRVKLFDDNNHQVNGVFELLNDISEFNQNWFINSHQEPFLQLKRLLQPDLGIFFYNKHIINSTQNSLFLTGLPIKTLNNINISDIESITQLLGKTLSSVGEQMGKYLKMLSLLPEFKIVKSTSYFDYRLKDANIGYQDVKSEEFFRSIFCNSTDRNISFSLLLFLSMINFIHYVLPKLIIKFPETVFKIKFITLYHLVSSLKKLQQYCYSQGLLSEELKHYFQSILKDSELKMLVSQKQLRNILVHYKVDKISSDLLDCSWDLEKLVEFSYNGKKFQKINRIIDSQIQRISLILEKWLNWKGNPTSFF